MSSSSSYYDFNGRYFVPGHGISRHIMLSQIHIYLGPRASARPYTYRGREGYLVDSPGPVLTVAQINDLKRLSDQYEQQAANRMSSLSADAAYYSNYNDVRYEDQPSPFQDQEEAYVNMPVLIVERRRR